MDPASGNEERVSGHDGHSNSSFGHISEKRFVLLGVGYPLFVKLQIGRGGRNEHENLLTTKDVIPDRGATEIDMKVRI